MRCEWEEERLCGCVYEKEREGEREKKVETQKIVELFHYVMTMQWAKTASPSFQLKPESTRDDTHTQKPWVPIEWWKSKIIFPCFSDDNK